MTLAEAETQLAAWEAALAALTKGQSYSIAGRALTRVDIAECRNTIDWLEAKIAGLQVVAGVRRTVRYVG